MKLNVAKINIESSGDLEEKLFSIGDVGMVFDILRNKMYSDPIRAICREISCNARDAHREVGKFDVPCEITLPNTFEPFYKIKDFGPGISPDRVENIFIRYATSTKRDDNTQLGGFGIGSKTPFSYTDTFNVITCVDGIKYHYTCFVDETRVGKMALLSKEETTEPNGTEIVIPVKSLDFRKFIDDTEYVTRHWTVRPIIKGAHLNYKELEPTLKGNNYVVCKNDKHNNYTYREFKLIVDGIEYPLEFNQLKGFTNSHILDAVNGTVYLYFNIGDLSLSATREAVHLDKNTQKKINDRLEILIKDLTTNINQQLDACKDLWQANLVFNNDIRRTFANLDFLGTPKWKGINLSVGSLSISDCSVFEFTKGKHTRNNYDPNKIHRRSDRCFNFLDNAAIFLCDLEISEPQVKHISKAFSDNPNLRVAFVIKPYENIKLDDVVKKYHLKEMGARNLSEIAKAGKSYTFSGVRMLVFKFDTTAKSFKQVSAASIEEDNSKKIICSLTRDKYYNVRNVMLKNKKVIANDVIKSILNANPGYSIYGVDNSIPVNKVEENFADFITIDNFIDNKVIKNNKINLKKIKYALRNKWNINRNHSNADLIQSYRSKVLDQKSLYLQFIDLNLELSKITTEEQGLLNAFETISGVIPDKDVDSFIKDNPELDLQKMKTQVNKQYPLLEYLDCSFETRGIEPLIHYINLIDKEV